jgi:type IV secretory pathway component VirB8
MREVFIAKNGTPYVKDENGKVRFISSAEWEEYKVRKPVVNNSYFFLTALILMATTLYLLNVVIL